MKAMREEMKRVGDEMRRMKNWKVVSLFLAVFDIVAIYVSYLFALWIRFDGLYQKIPAKYMQACLEFLPFYSVIVLIVFYFFRLYRCMWRFIGYEELVRMMYSFFVCGIIHCVGITAFWGRMPISYYVIGIVMQFGLSCVVRFSYRLFLRMIDWNEIVEAPTEKKNIMIIGAGAAGQMILRDVIKSREVHGKVCCLIDDDHNKWNRFIENVPIVGGRECIQESVQKYKIKQILCAIPKASNQDRKEILDICKETGCEVKSLPGIFQFVNDQVSLATMQDVDLLDLLGRDPIEVEMGEIFQQLKGKVILVTGGGGSIGSELCRQIARHEPKQLIIFDIYENNAYSIEQELKRTCPNLNLEVLIGSVRDSQRINSVFSTYHPDIVYHAAAHKHVPLMEVSPNEAIKNNVIGTYKTAYAALMNQCKRFVLISTDKAVNPTNIMGASKRLCEMVIQSMDAVSKTGNIEKLPFLHQHGSRVDILDGEELDELGRGRSIETGAKKFQTDFVAVRFGNVLGSNGSVIPLFKKQIESGGPVTVTHKDIIRYFMTIPEAVSLVLEAGTYAKGGEIFVLDMGDPVKIDTLARNLIKFSGFKPDEDIQIVYTGLRPGEKLYEEKLMAEEGMEKTANRLIHIGKPIAFDKEKFFGELEELAIASYKNSPEIVSMVAKVVTTFHPEREV